MKLTYISDHGKIVENGILSMEWNIMQPLKIDANDAQSGNVENCFQYNVKSVIYTMIPTNKISSYLDKEWKENSWCLKVIGL